MNDGWKIFYLETRIYDFVCLQGRDKNIEYPEEHK